MNGKDYDKGDLIVSIAADVKNIKETQKEKFDIIFNKLDNYGKRISEVEIEQAAVRGQHLGKEAVVENLIKEIDAKPSAGKIIVWVSIIVTVIISLGVLANITISKGAP